MSSHIKAMVMSAGLGSRLEPLTLAVPKPLVPIANKPVMTILFEKLADIGIRDVICNTYYLAEQIIAEYSNNDFGINFNYIKEETLSGTAGGLKKCQFFFEPGSCFVVLSADGLTNADIKKGIEIHKNSGAIATIGVKQVSISEVSNFGVVVTDENGFITEFQEKPDVKEAKSNFINTGIYIFNYEIFDYIPQNCFYDFAKDVFPKLISKHSINTFKITEYWNDIGTIKQYIQANQDVFVYDLPHSPIKVKESGKYISDTIKFPDSVKFFGNSIIGKNVNIGENSIIENSVIWDNVTIGENLHIKDSVIGSNTSIMRDLDSKCIGVNEILESKKVAKL